MEAIMGSSSNTSSPYLKLVSCKDTKLPNSLLRSPLHHSLSYNHKNKDVDFKLSLSVSSTHGGSRRAFRPISLSSSNTQAEVKSQELHIEESLNGYTIEAKVDENLGTKAEVPDESLGTKAEVPDENLGTKAEVVDEDLGTKGKEETQIQTQTVRVRFQLQRKCSFGQNFLIVGDDPIFGLWDPTNAIPLTWSDGHVWTVDLDIPIGRCIKFKFVMQEITGKFTWQPGPDRILECSESEKIITLCEDWENPDSRRIIEAGPTMNQVEESAATPETQMVAADEGTPVESSLDTTGTSSEVKKSSENGQTEESKGYAINMNEMLVSNETVPVLVPGLSQLSTTDTDQKPSANNEGSKSEPESAMNGTAMVATGVELKLPELDSKQHENQDSCDPNQHQQETQHVVEEQDHEITEPAKSLPIQPGNNFMQKFFGIFGIFGFR